MLTHPGTPRTDTCTFDFDDLDTVEEANKELAEDEEQVLLPGEVQLPGGDRPSPSSAEEEYDSAIPESRRRRAAAAEVEDSEKREAARKSLELQIELHIQWRLEQIQEGEGQLGASILVDDGNKRKTFISNALNDSASRLWKHLGREDKVSAAGAEWLRERFYLLTAFLSGLLPFRFAQKASQPCRKLAEVLRDNLCKAVAEWLDGAVKETPLHSLEDLQVHAVVSVLKDAQAVLQACRAAKIDTSNDGLRRAALGKSAIVLETDENDSTARCNVLDVGEVWFPVAALAQLGTSRGSTAKAREAAEASLRAAASSLKSLAALALTQGPLERQWLDMLTALTCKYLSLDSAATDCLNEELLSCFQGDFSDFEEGWMAWALCNRSKLSRICRTSPLLATRLLHQLRARYQVPSWQQEYRACRKAADLAFGSEHLQTLDMTFGEQAAVITHFGFAALPRGVTEMRHEMELHMDRGDLIVRKLVTDIHFLLDKKDMRKLVPTVRTPSLHTVGDSHSTFGWPGFVLQHFLGSWLCYNIARMDVQTLDPPVQAGDAVCFCFGEIDCRCHVHKHCNADRNYQEVVDELVSRYFSHLRTQVPLLPDDVEVLIYNIVPPARGKVLYPDDVMKFLNWGSDEQRRSYVLYFNQRLRAECSRAGYKFFDVYNDYCDEEGFLIHEFSDGKMHIQDGRFILQHLQHLFSLM